MDQVIEIKGAKVNNLKNISVKIPRNKFIVLTGLSGSGKSSLAFDTLYAEGQRLYLESLNVYVRQFVGKIQKPNVDYIKGLSPTIAIRQKVGTRNPRSTVGTLTEIYDYLRIFFARIGKLYSPINGKEIIRHSISDIVDFILSKKENSIFAICFELKMSKSLKVLKDKLGVELTKGFTRIVVNYEILEIEDILEASDFKLQPEPIFLLVDRIIVNDDKDSVSRISDSVQIALDEGEGKCIIIDYIEKKIFSFSDTLEMDGKLFENPTPNFFNFNSPQGSCKNCNGLGAVFGIDLKKVLPNTNLSIQEGAIAPWNTLSMTKWLVPLLKNYKNYKISLRTPYSELSEKEKNIVWNGYKQFQGLNKFFEFLKQNYNKIQYKMLLNKYRGSTICRECNGTRVRNDAQNIKIDKKTILDLLSLPINKLYEFFKNIKLTSYETDITKIIIKEIKNRLYYLNNMGLSYLTLMRSSASLSGGEYQRSNLATSLNSSLLGTIYILDEPTVGLHPRDTEKLINALWDLKNSENTLIVVEHDEEVIKKADEIIEIGPEAGSYGGNVIFQGTFEDLKKNTSTHTAKYFNGTESIRIPLIRRTSKKYLHLKKASEHNLKNIDVKIPLNVLTVLTGVSGSGKTTLIKKVLKPIINNLLDADVLEKKTFSELGVDLDNISFLEYMDQSGIVKNSRSNPLTFTKCYEDIRILLANQFDSIENNITPSMFSFNSEGGRCEECKGEGIKKIEMQFMADIILTCEKCHGKRFQKKVLDVKYNSKNIYDILELTIDDALLFFSDHYIIINKLKSLQKVGLGYIKLGQSSSSLSGGEAQRLKLSAHLKDTDRDSNGIFIFDEPTSGLHPFDINKLLLAFNKLLDKGNTVIIVEHNLDIIKCADWIIDLGPEGGEHGGYITFEGTPEQMIKENDNITAKYLREKF